MPTGMSGAKRGQLFARGALLFRKLATVRRQVGLKGNKDRDSKMI